MGIGGGIGLMIIGAILAFAVRDNVSGVDLTMIGFICIAGGALALILSLKRGVRGLYGNDSSAPWCTVGNPSRFFSHRRDTPALGTSGRMAAGIWIG